MIERQKATPQVGRLLRLYVDDNEAAGPHFSHSASPLFQEGLRRIGLVGLPRRRPPMVPPPELGHGAGKPVEAITANSSPRRRSRHASNSTNITSVLSATTAYIRLWHRNC